MFGIHDFPIFLVTGIVLNIAPGPDTFYILGRTVAQGRNAGIASVLGISCGALFHTIMAALGLSAILAASASAFFVVKLIGAIYLAYLGIRMIVSKSSEVAIPSSFSSTGFWAIVRQGMITSILNPKVALFFLAFLPQFITTNSPTKFFAFVSLGFCFMITGTIWCLTLVWLASRVSESLRQNQSFSSIVNRTAGSLFLFLGIRLALAK